MSKDLKYAFTYLKSQQIAIKLVSNNIYYWNMKVDTWLFSADFLPLISCGRQVPIGNCFRLKKILVMSRVFKLDFLQKIRPARLLLGSKYSEEIYFKRKIIIKVKRVCSVPPISPEQLFFVRVILMSLKLKYVPIETMSKYLDVRILLIVKTYQN